MDPKSLLLASLREQVTPSMLRLGFTLVPSRPAFTRKTGDVIHEVSFGRSRHNGADRCSFWSAWAVRSPELRSWYTAFVGQPPQDQYLVVTNDWLLEGWPRSPIGFSLTSDEAHNASEMDAFLQGGIQVGIPFLEQNSTTESAVAFWQKRGLRTDRVVELLLMSGQEDRARSIVGAEFESWQASHSQVLSQLGPAAAKAFAAPP